MFANSHDEEVKLDTLQRIWQSHRRTSAKSFFEDNPELKEIFVEPQNACSPLNKDQYSSPVPPTFTSSDVESEDECFDSQERDLQKQSVDFKRTTHLILDASELGDLPARYVIRPVESHQFPVVGVYIDKGVVPGFKYRVRPLPGLTDNGCAQKCLFGGKALTLKSIGRGYARRFTFEANENALNKDENYFWSDNRPEGFVFELEVISEGDKFTLLDVNREAQGTLEVTEKEYKQIEIGRSISKEGIEKRVKVKFTAKVEFYETGVAHLMPLDGVAICVKRKGRLTAEIVKIVNVNIKHHRYYLTPGYEKNFRRVTVRGLDVGDVPTKYTMTGLEPCEIPVVGTYVDPRIIPGFYYRVRPNHRKQHLFNGRALKLNSIGIGYAKRLTFMPDSLVNPDNYLWSDNHPDGLGLEPIAVQPNMTFSIIGGGQVLGTAKVFRADLPQKEENMKKEITPSGKYAIVKYIHVDVMCHVKLEINGNISADNDQLMRVYGLAVVRKEPNSNEARVVAVENVGLDSQLNLLFARTHTDLTFVPLN